MFAAEAVSDEPDDANGIGDGKTTGDIKVTVAACGGVILSSNASPRVSFDPVLDQLELRAERASNLNGRVYTITVTATDAAGYQSIPSTTTVSVPLDQS